MNTNKKFTVILSAFHGTDALTNYVATEKLARFLNVLGIDYSRAVGVYEGNPELSFAIHTSRSSVVRLLTTHALHELKQECILVSNNQRRNIKLVYAGNNIQIGTHFDMMVNSPKSKAYTVLNDCYYLVV